MKPFKQFIVLAEMRTGSNLLEENLNQYADISCYGEAFNPHFIGYPSKSDLFGMTQDQREKDPFGLLNTMREHTDGVSGFRFFHDHDPRIIDICLDDPSVAKIILTRNPLDSFISWKIASATGQWKLTNAQKRKEQTVRVDVDEFEQYLQNMQDFQVQILNRLQKTGQTAFYISYDDLQDVDVMNGLAQYLGSAQQLEKLSKKLKKQNPAPICEKVENYDDVQGALVGLDRFNLTRTPNFEPRRGPMVRNYVAAARSPLLFMSIKSGPDASIRRWLAALDDVSPDQLITGFSQKSLRQWCAGHADHRTFTVVRHPVVRAYDAFCRHILTADGPESYKAIRNTLRRVHEMPLPVGNGDKTFGVSDVKCAFVSFLKFLKSNLSNQTSIRVDLAWASQSHIIQGFSGFLTPDLVVREDRLQEDLGFLVSSLNIPFVSVPHPPYVGGIALDDIYDAEIESMTRDAYQKDYLNFGFAAYS